MKRTGFTFHGPMVFDKTDLPIKETDHMYYLWGMHGIWWIFWLFLWIAFFSFLMPVSRSTYRQMQSPLQLLQRRYAGGEIATEEYEERRATLLRDQAK